MADLKCTVESCKYNTDSCCSKGDIYVGGKNANRVDETSCESYAKRGENSYTGSVSHPSKTVSIDCEAMGCSHNSNYKCVANHVDIKGSSSCECSGQTACATFCDK